MRKRRVAVLLPLLLVVGPPHVTSAMYPSPEEQRARQIGFWSASHLSSAPEQRSRSRTRNASTGISYRVSGADFR